MRSKPKHLAAESSPNRQPRFSRRAKVIGALTGLALLAGGIHDRLTEPADQGPAPIENAEGSELAMLNEQAEFKATSLATSILEGGAEHGGSEVSPGVYEVLVPVEGGVYGMTANMSKDENGNLDPSSVTNISVYQGVRSDPTAQYETIFQFTLDKVDADGEGAENYWVLHFANEGQPLTGYSSADVTGYENDYQVMTTAILDEDYSQAGNVVTAAFEQVPLG